MLSLMQNRILPISQGERQSHQHLQVVVTCWHIKSVQLSANVPCIQLLFTSPYLYKQIKSKTKMTIKTVSPFFSCWNLTEITIGTHEPFSHFSNIYSIGQLDPRMGHVEIHLVEIGFLCSDLHLSKTEDLQGIRRSTH